MRNRAFAVLALAVFGATLGIGMVSPILPVIAQDLGASGALLGLSFSAFAISQSLSTIPFGRRSDRWGRRPFIVSGFLIYTVAALGFIVATSVGEIIVWRFVAGFGTAAVFPIAFAYIGDMTPAGKEGTYMATFNLATWVGFGAGPLVGGIVRDVGGPDAAFLTMGGILFSMGLAVFLFLPESARFTGQSATQAGDEPPAPPSVPISVQLRDRTVQAIAIFNFAAAVAFGAAFGFIAVYMEDELGAGPLMVGVVLAMRTWVNGALSPLWGRVADHYDRPRLVAAGLIIGAVFTFFVPEMRSTGAVLGIFILMGLAEGVSFPAAMAITADRGRTLGMGGLMGIGQTAGGLGLVSGSLIGGVFASTFEIGATFQFAGVLMLVGGLAFYFTARGVRPLPQETVEVGAPPELQA